MNNPTMKRTIKNLLWAAAAVLASCTDGIEVPGPSGEGFEGVDQTCGYVRNLDEPRSTTTLELRNGKRSEEHTSELQSQR